MKQEMKHLLCVVLAGMATVCVMAQRIAFSQPHGFCDAPFQLSLTVEDNENPVDWTIRYTLDSSTPTSASPAYSEPLYIGNNTIVRAAAFAGEDQMTDIATATYLFVDDVLNQSDSPEGYPSEWGSYIQMSGIAKADYGMDPEMTKNATLAPKIREGLKSIPVLSIVTDRDNLFGHENNEETGGIYIFTGPPVGDATGHGWTRPASIELMGGEQNHDLSTTCGLRLHGGHGRLAEKNPKHSFRLVFKEAYGPKSLKYPLFGEDEPDKFDQLVLRCHFGNAWQHWMESNRQKAQYTRDVWARRMQRKMGHTSVNALYVHLFLNGMYWGLYNIAERVDDQFGKDHLGGKKSDIDVIKIEEDGGNHLEASEGDMEAWNLMVKTAARASDEEAYEQLDSLLDIEGFIDYMLINQYGGNTDWDHHNWYAIRRRGLDSEGFRFLCWDSELILDNVDENVLTKNNGSECPTGIFHNLLTNAQFKRQYLRRAKQLLADDGLLGEESVVQVWDSLYHNIETALYDEAARWGDYRRDVHPYTTKGELYTVDGHYQTERNRLLTQYFPRRSGKVLQSIISFVDIDDFEMPDGWVELAASMFHEWDGTDADAQPLDKSVNVDWNMNRQVSGGTAVAGFVNVDHNQFADVSQYEKLVLRGSGNGLRILVNRLVPHGSWKQITVSFNSNDPYWDSDLSAIVVPLDMFRTMLTYQGETRNDNFVHLHVLKVDWNQSLNLKGAYLVGAEEDIATIGADESVTDGKYYNLQGQQVAHPSHGIYIYNGKKILIK
ncbi:MAG: CotH kinase family protein [Bacteroidales bacterium]|nr:CotH kinase family protein [Bacteroidales bacterium]